jgi:hypothetical protein
VAGDGQSAIGGVQSAIGGGFFVNFIIKLLDRRLIFAFFLGLLLYTISNLS